MAETKQYLDYTGLTQYNTKEKNYIDTHDAQILSNAKEYSDSLADNYDPAGTAQTKFQELSESKADKATTLEGYGIKDAYTKTQTDSAITTAIANADHLKREIVESLPDVAEADEHTIYMVGTGSGSEDSVYEEYMLINGGFEKIGSSEVDLTNYALKSYVDQAKSEAITSAGTQTDNKISAKTGAIEGTIKDYIDNKGANYATAKQGEKADSALQKADIAEGSANGAIEVKGTSVSVHGLGSAAYAESSAFETAGTAQTKVNALATGAVATNTKNITALSSRIDSLESVTYVPITEEEISSLFS